MGFRIVVDESVCGSHGRCWSIYPALFEQRPDSAEGGGRASRDEYPESDREAAARMVQLCPESAISIVELG